MHCLAAEASGSNGRAPSISVGAAAAVVLRGAMQTLVL
jgi:hypothetical protein